MADPILFKPSRYRRCVIQQSSHVTVVFHWSAEKSKWLHFLLFSVEKQHFKMERGAAGSSGRLPYQALVNQTLDIEVKGLPNDFTLKKPSFYGRKQLEMILKAAEQISFQISAAAKPLHSSVEEAVAEAVPIIEGNELISVIWFPFKGTSNACSVCGADFYDPDKNRKRKWRSWSQCLVCHGWSHTACGFKRNMCAKCHTE
uniref:Uncharacterized protein n=1 Tax=Dicentrarchus labrax TaxID=13489 RepID=A0A8P4GPJ4_DICLA